MQKDANREKALELSLGTIEKQYGKGAIMRLDTDGKDNKPEVGIVPSGSVSLDLALGIGGYPRGRIIAYVMPN